MAMNEFRRIATKIDQHLQQLSARGVSDSQAIINRMMGYAPDLHKIWVETYDSRLMALSSEFPEFYRYALIMEEAFKAERKRESRPYDHMTPLSEKFKQLEGQLLTTAATLERGYQAFLGGGNLSVFQSQVNELSMRYQRWLSDLEDFKAALRKQGAEPKALAYVNEAFGRMAERLQALQATIN